MFQAVHRVVPSIGVPDRRADGPGPGMGQMRLRSACQGGLAAALFMDDERPRVNRYLPMYAVISLSWRRTEPVRPANGDVTAGLQPSSRHDTVEWTID